VSSPLRVATRRDGSRQSGEGSGEVALFPDRPSLPQPVATQRLGNVERYVLDHPDDPDAAAMRKRIRTWRDGYLRWGRTTMGFALYLHRKP